MQRQDIAAWILCVTAALSLPGATARADPSEPALRLEGAWQLERRENFEEYLKASGAPWWKRKLAQLGSSRMRQTIEVEGIQLEITNKNPVENRTLNFVADGVTEVSADAASGDRMTWTARIEDGAFVIDGHGDLGHRIIRREVADGMMVMTIVNPDADAQCKLFFKRVEVD